ncbi:MAG TPA: CRISPR-associated endonuclease Cas2 [Kiritimatiellia bacterium]|nr:CRISPR-associated endonuclease Cas2 [Kiritimatiellia bacterium]HMO98481.1 CRISPR-associated endonuclease Cas2 [Kiritimatiellia bacterium]HMP96512.1 CRISPR-associated endonuclease Cas2 [Kiritimatiellia bacterium]
MKTYLVAYDISNARRLQKVAKLMTHYGVRAQKSVFECALPDPRREEMEKKLKILLDEEEDQVRIYAVPQVVLEGQRVLGREGAALPGEVVVG